MTHGQRYYYAATDTWVSAPAEARDFEGPPEAIRFAHDRGLEDVELVFSYNDPELNVSFALHSSGTVEEPVAWLEALCQRSEHQFA